jgi:hypothetical protein
MAEVLRTFMHARLAGVLAGAEGVDYPEASRAERMERMAVLKELMRLEGRGGDQELAGGKFPRRTPARVARAGVGRQWLSWGSAGSAPNCRKRGCS